MIAHPDSPFKGKHYPYPVESVDIVPTVLELLRLARSREELCTVKDHNKKNRVWKCPELDGKSLAPVVLGVTPVDPITVDSGGTVWPRGSAAAAGVQGGATGAAGRGRRRQPVQMTGRTKVSLVQEDAQHGALLDQNLTDNPHFLPGKTMILKRYDQGLLRRRRLELSTMQHAAADSLVGYVQAAGSVGGLVMPKLRQDFAISQSIRCAKLKDIPPRQERIQNSFITETPKRSRRRAIWIDCDSRKHDPTQECVLGYSMRTPEYRYTAYLRFDRTLQLPDVESLPYEEELFDHKNGTMRDFTHREIHNLAYRSAFGLVVARLRTQLIEEVVKPLFRKKHGNDKIFDTVAVA